MTSSQRYPHYDKMLAKSLDELDQALYHRDSANTGSGVQGNTPSVSMRTAAIDADLGRVSRDGELIGRSESTDIREQELLSRAGRDETTPLSPVKQAGMSDGKPDELLNSDVISPSNPREARPKTSPNHY